MLHTASPFTLGPFAVDPMGRISTRSPDTASFTCRWRQRLVRTQWTPNDAGDVTLVSRVILGRVPSTGADDSDKRRRGLTVLRALPAYLPPEWQVRLLPDHRLWLEALQSIAQPTTAADLVARLSSLFLALTPFIDLLDEYGMTPSTASKTTV